MPLIAEFSPYLTGFDRARLDAAAGTVYGLTADWRLGYHNPAWTRFAVQNQGGAVLGQFRLGDPVLPAFAGDMRDYYRDVFERVARTGQTFELRYQCSSAELVRDLHMRVLPLCGGGVLVSNSLVKEVPADAGSGEVPSAYVPPFGAPIQCAGCRRVQRWHRPEAWDFVPQLVAHPVPGTRQTLCPECEGTYRAARRTLDRS